MPWPQRHTLPHYHGPIAPGRPHSPPRRARSPFHGARRANIGAVVRLGRDRIFVALALALALPAVVPSTACRRGGNQSGRRALLSDAPDTADASGRRWLTGIINPWTWPRAIHATARQRAIEDIGPYELPVGAGAAAVGAPTREAEPVNSNADYWTRLVGIAWDRDVDIVLDNEPVDLDGDGVADTRVSRRVHARGGVLANPALFGLVPTPDDPRGRVGMISASTGVLGLREALRPDGSPSGQIGMTCFVCHGGENPVDGRVTLGLPGTRFDYGLLLATSALLDDDNLAAAAVRRARGFPPGRTVRARLLLAGPGRQDLTGEFGLDVTVPGLHSARYPGTARVRQGTRGLVNPISVPGLLAVAGLSLQNWSGSEDSDGPWLRRLIALARQPDDVAIAAFGLPAGDLAATRRALLLDLRNLGTLGLQQDSFPGLLWADALYGHTTLAADELAAIPPMYAAAAVRQVLAEGAAALQRPAGVDVAAVARGRALFVSRVVGAVANRQILKSAPHAYAASRLAGPILAPIDSSQPIESQIPVRCADCHNGTPLARTQPLASNPPPLGRCTHCHLTHPAPPDYAHWASIRALAAPDAASAEVAFCEGCHHEHRDFGPFAATSSRLFPFDANGDGNAQGDESADARAGGIGTEPLLAFDVPRPDRPTGRFGLDVPVIGDAVHAGPVRSARTGVAWVRTAPLVGVFATAPYLHNGSVPTLRALLEPARRRPVSFPLGAAGFVFDTRIAGNRNIGHEFGTALSDDEKNDLVAFLRSL